MILVNSDTNGNIAGQQGHYPLGESWYSQSTTTKWQFTSYERDSESSLDYAMFRYYGSRLGRFRQPDAPFADQSPANPQTWNLYSYARNNPLYFVDPTGRSGRGACGGWSPCGVGSGDNGQFPAHGGGDSIWGNSGKMFASVNAAKKKVVKPQPSLPEIKTGHLGRDPHLDGTYGGETRIAQAQSKSSGQSSQGAEGSEVPPDGDTARPSWAVNDFYSLQVCAGPVLTGCATVTEDIYGGIYFGFGGGLGEAWPIGLSIFAVGQRIEGEATREQTRDFTKGWGVDATAGLLFGYSESYRFFREPSEPYKSTGRALVLPAALGVGAHYTWQLRSQRHR